MNAADGVWAIGDVTGIWPLTYVGKYQGRVAAANILGTPREANYEAVPRVVFTDPQAASVGEAEGAVTATVSLAEVPRTSTYTRAYAEKPGFMTLVSDGERLTGAYALGPEAGEWLQQATVAIRARVPLELMRDVIQPFPTFSEAFLAALEELGARSGAAYPAWDTTTGADQGRALALLREAEAAHGKYETEELGGVRDEEWAAWYAEFIVNALRERAARDDPRPG